VARGTTGEFLNFVFLHELLPERELIRGRRVIHAEDKLTRTHKAFRCSMAFEAPVHVQRVFAPHQRHFVHTTVTRRTTDAFVNVNAVIEVNEARQIMNARPLDRAIRAEALAHRRQHGAVRPDLRMAVHADLGCGYAGERARLDGGVAVTAIDAVVADVMLMTERNRLDTSDADFSDIGRLVDSRECGDQSNDQEDGTKDTELGDGIGAGMKDLRHSGPPEERAGWSNSELKRK
jgi:hypothetical protein